MGEWIKQVVDENSTYYILAWRPQGEEQKRRRFKNIETVGCWLVEL